MVNRKYKKLIWQQIIPQLKDIFCSWLLAITLVLPVALILLSYLDIISGLAQYVAAIAVIAAGVYIVGGGILMFVQDGKDGKALSE